MKKPVPAPERTRILPALGFGVLAALVALAHAQEPPKRKPPAAPVLGMGDTDPAKIVGPEECAKCHTSEIAAWNETRHCKTYNQMHATKEAQAIAKKLGIKSIKRDALCKGCHYTTQGEPGKDKSIAGISCELCHGEAKGWTAVHNDYGGKGATRQNETAEHRKARWANAEKLGMIRPGKIYDLAANCFGCHTVPEEKLVNVGGHRAGTDEFDLVAYSQGEVLHNYSADPRKNAPAPPERKRVLYVVGALADLEFSLRGLAEAKAEGEYSKNMAERIARARAKLDALTGKAKIPEVAAALEAQAGVKLAHGNKDELYAAAAKVGAQAEKFSDAADGKGLEAVDTLLPAPGQYKGTPLK